jgi:hypothetical protein
MSHESMFGEEWFASLEEFDRQIAEAVAAEGCRHCGGPLHQGNYERKPRGGQIAGAGEAFTLRHSLCCGREGCRRRALPPSLRFLGRRVYLEAVVLLATVQAIALKTLRQAREVTGVPAFQRARCVGGMGGGQRCFRVRQSGRSCALASYRHRQRSR